MYKFLLIFVVFGLVNCAQKETYDETMLEKYPKCYHKNIKIYKKCVLENEKGNETTALEIENSGLPIYN